MMDSSVLDESREPLRLPAFEKAVMQSVTCALEQWRDEAMDGELSVLAQKPLLMILPCQILMHGIAHGCPCTVTELFESRESWEACRCC